MSRQDFDGNGSVEAGIPSAIDFAHAAGAHGRLDFIRPEFRARGYPHGHSCCVLSFGPLQTTSNPPQELRQGLPNLQFAPSE
jgi:hypothetical protein